MAATGTDPNAQGSGAGAPAAGANAGGEGAGGAGGAPQSGAQGGAGGAPGAQGFAREKLHPALRDMPAEQINDLFETMANGLRQAQSRPALAANGQPQDGTASHVPPAPPVDTSKDAMRKYFDPSSAEFDPSKGVSMIAQQNYGGLLGDINRRALGGLMAQFRQNLPDFKDYEGDVQAYLQPRDPTTISERDILNAYFVAKGYKMTLKDRQAAAQLATTTAPPTPGDANGGAKKEEPLSDIENTVALKMFGGKRDREGKPLDPIKEYRRFVKMDEDGVTMDVPIGGGKKA